MKKTGLFVAIMVLIAGMAFAEEGIVPFTDEHWDLARARVSEYLDRQAVIGTAVLKEVEFHNGVIEFDIAATAGRSYPGLRFRIQDNGDFEHFYVRPHRTGLYGDAVQYAPNIGGVSAWQLFSGPGYTSATGWEKDRWVPVRLEIKGDRTRVFLDGAEKPVLEVDRLELGDVKGGLALNTLGTGRAWISNFRYRRTDDLKFDRVAPPDPEPGVIIDWEISRVLGAYDIREELHPDRYDHPELEWSAVNAFPSGLLDFSRSRSKSGRGYAAIYARTTVSAEKACLRKYSFGYSDVVTVFLNGEPVFKGESAYTQRDSAFLGILGTYDHLWLPLKKGKNELLVLIQEVFGGWGIKFRDASTAFAAEGMQRSWEQTAGMRTPETALYDPDKKVVYVTQYDAYNRSTTEGIQSIAKLSVTGDLLDADWAAGLFNPTGMALHGGKLYVVERMAVAEIDRESGEIVKRTMFPTPRFANDIAAGPDGTLYVSDSAKGVLYRSQGDAFEPWLADGELAAPNGLHVMDGKLLIGDSGDSRLKSADLATGKVETILKLSPGVIDGIEDDGAGNILVSLAQGRVYRINPQGEVTRLLDLEPSDTATANFDFIEDARMLVIPTLTSNGVVAYSME